MDKGTDAMFQNPYAGAIDSLGANAYICDSNNNVVRLLTLAPPPPSVDIGLTTTLAGSPSNGWADGLATQAMLSQPNGITISKISPEIFALVVSTVAGC